VRVLVREFARWVRERLVMPPVAAFVRVVGARVALRFADDAHPSGGVAADAPVLDEQRQRDARRYATLRRVLSLVSLGLDALVVAALLFTGLGFSLRDALAGAAGWQPVSGTAFAPLQIAAYFGVFFAAVFLIQLPLAYYSGYVLPHRFGVSTQTLGGWIADQIKGLVLSLVLGLAAVEVVYVLLALAPNWWWLWVGGVMLVFIVVFAILQPVLLLPLFNKFTPLPDGELKDRLLARAASAHTRVRGVFTMNMSVRTTAANAFLAGLGGTRRIVIADTLLKSFAPDEIDIVVTHELGHHVHHDIPKLIAMQTVLTLGGLYIVNLVLHAVTGAVSGYHGLADAATMPLIAAAFGIFSVVTTPLANGFTRVIEHQADVYALESTGNPAAYISCMTRLANQNLAEAQPPAWVEFLLYDHPSPGSRIAYGRRYAAAH
jgi:Zn-dependent protease with chaperone function